MKSVRYLLAALVLAVIAPQAANAEIYWEIQGAGMGFSNKHYEDGFDYMDKKSSGRETSYHAGFGIGLFIPISRQYPFLLETGLQVRVGSFEYFEKVKKGELLKIINEYDNTIKYSVKDYTSVGTDDEIDPIWSIQVPVKFNYVYNLNEKSSLRFGFGPFFRYSFGDYFGGVLSVRGEDTMHFGPSKETEVTHGTEYKISSSNFMIGLTPSASYCYRNFSVGLTYEVSVMFFNNLKLENYPNRYKHAFMLTVGFKFKTKVWRRIGKGLGSAASVLGDIAVAYAEAQNGVQPSYTGNPSTDYSDSGSYDDSSSSSKSNLESNYKSVYTNHERAAISTYNTLTNLGLRVKKNGKDVGGTNGQQNSVNYIKQKQNLREIQGRMRKTRQEAAKKGILIEKSRYEDITVSY